MTVAVNKDKTSLYLYRPKDFRGAASCQRHPHKGNGYCHMANVLTDKEMENHIEFL